MPKKKQPNKLPEVHGPETKTEIKPVDPEEPLNLPDNDPDIIPDEDDPSQAPPPYEKPPFGEGP